VHQAIFADVKEPSSRTAVPAIRQALWDVSLEPIVQREREHLLIGLKQVAIDGEMVGRERLKLAAAVVKDPHRAAESQGTRAMCDGASVFRTSDRATPNRIHCNGELRVFRQHASLRPSTWRLFFEVLSGFTLSLLICR
jgi:hypothetical protein